MFLPLEVQKQPQINAAITEVLEEMSPAVRRIRFEIAEDWSGDWAIFFRVILSDEASQGTNFSEVARRVTDRMMERLDWPNLGMFPHFNFRSESEQAKLNDPAWA